MTDNDENLMLVAFEILSGISEKSGKDVPYLMMEFENDPEFAEFVMKRAQEFLAGLRAVVDAAN